MQVQSAICVPPQSMQLSLTELHHLETFTDKVRAWGWQWHVGPSCQVTLTHRAEVLGHALGAIDLQVSSTCRMAD